MRKLFHNFMHHFGAICTLSFAFFLVGSMQVQAQLLHDGSFEGIRSNLPTAEGWTECEGTPDSQVLDGFGVGIFGIRTPASNGQRYLGLLADDFGTTESVGQSIELIGGQLYNGNIDIFRSEIHHSWNGTGRIEIWGGRSCGNDEELLWTSGTVTNLENWQNYSVTLLPRTTHSWLNLKAVLDVGSGEMTYLCVDNFNLLSSALAFDFVAFDVEANLNALQLNWETSTLQAETNFELDWSLDGNDFQAFQSKIGLPGESLFETTFSPEQNGKYFFRITAREQNGSQYLSQIVEIEWTKLKDLRIYPNPASEYLQIQSDAAEACNIRLINANGQLVLSGKFLDGEEKRLSLPNHLAAGLYFLECQIGQNITRKSVMIR